MKEKSYVKFYKIAAYLELEPIVDVALLCPSFLVPSIFKFRFMSLAEDCWYPTNVPCGTY